MRNRKFLILLYLVFISINSNGQTISDLSLKICDSINSHKYIESDTILLKQAEIYSKLLTEYLLNNIKTNPKNYITDFNRLNYKLTRELNKTCKSFIINKSSIFIFPQNQTWVNSGESTARF